MGEAAVLGGLRHPSLRTSPSARADKAAIDDDGYFWFVGRDDDVINTGGFPQGADICVGCPPGAPE